MNKTLKLLLFLGIISAVSGLLIGAVNEVVSPIIARNDAAAEQKSLLEIFPGAEFETLDYVDEAGTVLNVYEAKGNGYIVKTTGRGFGSEPIIVLVGFDNDGNTMALKVLQQQETNGFGSRCFEEENITALYLGRGLDESVDMLSNATFTSKALKSMITAAQAAVKEVR